MLNTELPFDPEIPCQGIYPREMKMYLHRNLNLSIHSNIIHNIPQVEKLKSPLISQLTNNMIYPQNGILFDNKTMKY